MTILTSRKANINQNQGGGDKLQGLAPVANRRAFFLNVLRQRAVGEDRGKIVCMNQLGGIGRAKSQFSSNAGAPNCEAIARQLLNNLELFINNQIANIINSNDLGQYNNAAQFEIVFVSRDIENDLKYMAPDINTDSSKDVYTFFDTLDTFKLFSDPETLTSYSLSLPKPFVSAVKRINNYATADFRKRPKNTQLRFGTVSLAIMHTGITEEGGDGRKMADVYKQLYGTYLILERPMLITTDINNVNSFPSITFTSLSTAETGLRLPYTEWRWNACVHGTTLPAAIAPAHLPRISGVAAVGEPPYCDNFVGCGLHTVVPHSYDTHAVFPFSFQQPKAGTEFGGLLLLFNSQNYATFMHKTRERRQEILYEWLNLGASADNHNRYPQMNEDELYKILNGDNNIAVRIFNDAIKHLSETTTYKITLTGWGWGIPFQNIVGTGDRATDITCPADFRIHDLMNNRFGSREGNRQYTFTITVSAAFIKTDNYQEGTQFYVTNIVIDWSIRDGDESGQLTYTMGVDSDGSYWGTGTILNNIECENAVNAMLWYSNGPITFNIEVD